MLARSGLRYALRAPQQVPKSISLEETQQYFKYMEVNGLTSSTSLAANADENNDDQDYAFMKLLSGNRAALAAPLLFRTYRVAVRLLPGELRLSGVKRARNRPRSISRDCTMSSWAFLELGP